MKLCTHPLESDDIFHLSVHQFAQLPYVHPDDLPEDAELAVVAYDQGYGVKSIGAVYYGDFGWYRCRADVRFNMVVGGIWKRNNEHRLVLLH